MFQRLIRHAVAVSAAPGGYARPQTCGRGPVADVRDQSLRLEVKPLLVSEEQKHDDQRCASHMVVNIVCEKSALAQTSDECLHDLILSRRAAGRTDGVTCGAGTDGGLANSSFSPSAMVGCVRIMSRKTVYGSPAFITTCTAAMISPVSTPNAVNP